MPERTSRSDRARDPEEIQRAFKEIQRAGARSRSALISVSKNVTRVVGAWQEAHQRMVGAWQEVHQGLVSAGAYLRDHESEIGWFLNHHLEVANNNFENAKSLPKDHPLRKMWERIGKLPFLQYVERIPELPYHKKPPARRGRPKGAGPVVSDKTLLPELHARVVDGAILTTAARELLQERGVSPQLLEHRTDYVVKLYRASYSKKRKK